MVSPPLFSPPLKVFPDVDAEEEPSRAESDLFGRSFSVGEVDEVPVRRDTGSPSLAGSLAAMSLRVGADLDFEGWC